VLIEAITRLPLASAQDHKRVPTATAGPTRLHGRVIRRRPL